LALKSFHKSVFKKIFYVKTLDSLLKKESIIFNKSCVIPKSFKNFTLKIYKGNIFRIFSIDKFNIGFKFGNFVFTRKPHTFIKKKKKSSNIIRR